MKFILKTFFLIILIGPLFLVAMLLFSVQQGSLVSDYPVLTHKDVKKARTILEQHDPRQFKPGTQHRLQLDEPSLTLIGSYGLQTVTQMLPGASMKIALDENLLNSKLSGALPKNPFGRFFNLQFSLSKKLDKLIVQNLIIGRWPIPDQVSAFIPEITGALLKHNEFWQLFQAALVDYQFTRKALVIDYHWRSEWEKLAKAKIREFTDHSSMTYYAKFLYEIPYFQKSSFEKVVSTLFKQVKIRSQNHDPVEENQAALQLLGQWALGKQTYGQWYLPYFSIRLKGRGDLAQHLLVSAAMSSHSNSELSNLVGTGKEISDSDGGSGFSFSDLAADRAGSLLGKLATADKASALKAQELLSNSKYSSNLLPDINRLPAPLTERQFVQQFGNIKDPRYEKMLKSIDKKIMSMPFFKQMGLLP